MECHRVGCRSMFEQTPVIDSTLANVVEKSVGRGLCTN